jgi:hypothetical protein
VLESVVSLEKLAGAPPTQGAGGGEDWASVPDQAAWYLRPLAGTSFEVAGINNNDQVIGTAHYRNGTRRAVLWQAGPYTMLPVPKAAGSRAVYIRSSSTRRHAAAGGVAGRWRHFAEAFRALQSLGSSLPRMLAPVRPTIVAAPQTYDCIGELDFTE